MMLCVTLLSPLEKSTIQVYTILQISGIESVGFEGWLMMGRYRPQDSLFLVDYIYILKIRGKIEESLHASLDSSPRILRKGASRRRWHHFRKYSTVTASLKDSL